MHVGNLTIEAAFSAFSANDLFGWSSFFGNRHKVRAAAVAAGINYRVAMTAGTRFGSKIPFLAELSKPGMFKKMGGFAKAHPPETFIRGTHAGGRGRGGARAGPVELLLPFVLTMPGWRSLGVTAPCCPT